METKFIEAENVRDGEAFNWGKFAVCRFDAEEWSRRSEVDGFSLLVGRGWTNDHVLVIDLQTGEAAMFRPGGYAHADLEKHKVWVCPLFEPFLTWLYTQELADLSQLPAKVTLGFAAAPPAMAGYRRSGVAA